MNNTTDTINHELLEKLQNAIKALVEVEHALEEALKPPKLDVCPFCGNHVIYHTTVYNGDGKRRFWVQCRDKTCRVQPTSPCRFTKEEAAADWNQRCKEIRDGQN